jgi:hypothetical protein
MEKRKPIKGRIDTEATSADVDSFAGPVTFPATIPPTETAIKIHGEGGARLILDIAESDLGAFLPALVMRMKRLKITMEDADAVR